MYSIKSTTLLNIFYIFRLSGFHENGNSGVCYHENWYFLCVFFYFILCYYLGICQMCIINRIAPNIDIHGTDWVISTDSRHLYRYNVSLNILFIIIEICMSIIINRSNGVSRMTDNQSPGYLSNKYRLGLNTGLYTGSTYESDWAVAEIIVFNRTLNPKEYKCLENHLANKYDICLTTYSPTYAPTPLTPSPTQNPTESQCLSTSDLTLRDYQCKSQDSTHDLYTQCEISSDNVFAWYDGESYNSLINEWFDKSGNCRNVKSSYITGDITTYSDLNGQTYLTGTTSTAVDFPYDVLPESYTLFHVTRYFDGTEGRILQSYDYDWYDNDMCLLIHVICKTCINIQNYH